MFKYRGRIKADADHHICLECFRSFRESNKQKELNMADEVKETPHIHGTPIVDEPGSVKEVFQWARTEMRKLEDRVSALEEVAASKGKSVQ